MLSKILPYINKILVLRPDGIGDAINSTPAMAALRETYPNAHISIVLRSPGAEIYANDPDVDEIIVYNEYNKGLRAKLHFIEDLRLRSYELVIVLCNKPEFNIMAYMSGAPYRAGWKYPRRKLGFVLTHKVDHYDAKGTKHEVDRNMEVMELVGAENYKRELKFYLTEEEEKWAEDFLSPYPSVPIVGIHPGGSISEKLWPSENFACMANKIIQNFNFQIMLFSGPGEDHLAQNIIGKMAKPPIFPTSIKLRQLAALIKKCSLFLCNDSGPMHIAAALKVPTVAIFGPTDYVRWRPYSEKAVVVRKDMDCWPCSIYKCKKEFECIKSISINDVWNAVKELTWDKNDTRK